MSSSSKLSAILVMCAGVLLMSLNDACSKWLVERYSPFQLLFVRSLLALPLTVALAWWHGGRVALKSNVLPLHALRGLGSVLAAWAFILSLRDMQLAEASTLLFTAPLFVALLSTLFLSERLDLYRTTALVGGFAGVLIVLRPGADAFQPSALLPILSAALYAVMLVAARKVPKSESMWTMMLYMTVFPLLFTSFVLFQDWPVLTAKDAVIFGCTAIFSTFGLTWISQAFRMGEATLVAPLDYTALLWASLLGFLVFGDVPTVWTYAGAIAIIGGSGLLIWTEAREAHAAHRSSVEGVFRETPTTKR
jgi:drug/metabolite transporter (DMT)-like permease